MHTPILAALRVLVVEHLYIHIHSSLEPHMAQKHHI